MERTYKAGVGDDARARSVPDRAVSHGQLGRVVAQMLVSRASTLGRLLTSEDVSATGARLTRQWSLRPENAIYRCGQAYEPEHDQPCGPYPMLTELDQTLGR